MYGAGAYNYMPQQQQGWLDQSRQPAPAPAAPAAAAQYNPQQPGQLPQNFNWQGVNNLVDQQRRQLLQPPQLGNFTAPTPVAIGGISEMVGQNVTTGPAPMLVGNSITDGLNRPQPQVGPPPPPMSDPMRPPGWQVPPTPTVPQQFNGNINRPWADVMPPPLASGQPRSSNETSRRAPVGIMQRPDWLPERRTQASAQPWTQPGFAWQPGFGPSASLAAAGVRVNDPRYLQQQYDQQQRYMTSGAKMANDLARSRGWLDSDNNLTFAGMSGDQIGYAQQLYDFVQRNGRMPQAGDRFDTMNNPFLG